MKTLLMAFALVLSVPAFAQEEADMSAELSMEELASVDALAARPGKPNRPGQPNRPGHPGGPGNGGPGHGGPGGPGHGGPGHGGPGWGQPKRKVECVAQNRRGMRFIGRANNQLQSQRESLRNCQMRSGSFLGRTCKVRACRVVYLQ